MIHVIPEDTFFILPWEALKGRVGLTVPSVRRKSLGAFAKHLGRWDLLLGKAAVRSGDGEGVLVR